MQTPLSQKCIDLAGVDLYLEGSERGRRRSVSPVQSTDLVPPASFPRRLKKGAFDETLSRGPVSGLPPHRNRPVLLSHKTVYHTAIYGSQKEDGSTQPGPNWKCGRNHDQVLGVCTGRRMAQPEADRRPLRLRAMPPGRLRRKRQNPHHAGRHNNRAGPCGRVRRLRGAVVGGTGGQRSSMTTPDIGWHYSRMEGAVTLLSGGTHTSSVCTSWTTATRAHCE